MKAATIAVLTVVGLLILYVVISALVVAMQMITMIAAVLVVLGLSYYLCKLLRQFKNKPST